MGRKKSYMHICIYCGGDTNVVDRPLYSDTYKGKFCDMECYNLEKLEPKKEEEKCFT